MRILFGCLLATALPFLVNAWAGKTGTNTAATTGDVSRRSFLVSAPVAAAAIGVSTLSSSPSIASAAAPIYQPPPHSLDEKVMVITGGTTGLGLESGKRLAAGGATVILTSRTLEKGNAAVQAVKDYLKELNLVNEKVYTVTLDLDDLEDVKSFPQRLAKSPAFSSNSSPSVDVLMNNAGVMAIPTRELTKDGYERTMQSNHLGHFALTAKLMPMLSKDARIINVSSAAHQFAGKGLELDNLNGEVKYGPWSSYGQSKLANIMFSKELQRRANAANLPLTAVSLHPGAVQTDLSRNMMGPEKFEAMKSEKSWKTDLLAKSLGVLGVMDIPQGANTQVYLAAGQGGSNIGGDYFENQKVSKPAGAANDLEKAQALWSVSEKLTGVEFTL